MTCPFEPREKQALLECPGLIERGEFLTTLMEMAVHGSKGRGRQRRALSGCPIPRRPP